MIFNMKTDNKIPLKDGYLTFLRDRLEISDSCRAEKIFILTGVFTSGFYGLWSVLTYNIVESPIMYSSGILILLTWVFATPFLIRRTYRQVLFYHEIGRIDMTENKGGAFKVGIKLRRGRIRFVYFNQNKQSIKRFIDKLEEFKLDTEYQFLSA